MIEEHDIIVLLISENVMGKDEVLQIENLFDIVKMVTEVVMIVSGVKKLLFILFGAFLACYVVQWAYMAVTTNYAVGDHIVSAMMKWVFHAV